MFVTRRANGAIKDFMAPMTRYWKGIRQAEAKGGVLPKLRGPATRILRDSYIRYGDFVGEDERGRF